MNEQKIFLILLILYMAISLGLWIYKAIKQVKYKNDERWSMIQLKANNDANLINWILVIVLLVIQVSVDSTLTITVSRLVTYGLIFLGIRNAIELGATLIYDRIM
ncbi:hypothetical protein SAMN04487884_109109 [Butyrivibrio fibrisolvens]|uniref:Uncharacterized protein n=1 Tax=Butyrivibrio fibrisolvens TaxID=831 RepID=A0A1H9RBW2_BUTFI|nr:hypothetical protein [Butyrivibrio fibrisolvens]SER70236.1 hypothetical protein SAMN04487884_109109 [Butyrivibrio fibrisolvens]